MSANSPTQKEVAKSLSITQTVKFGWFRYQSGLEGPYYFDLRSLPNFPDHFRTILQAYGEQAERLTPGSYVVMGVPEAGSVFATGVGVLQERPYALVQKDQDILSNMFSGICPDTLLEDLNDFLGRQGLKNPLITSTGYGVSLATTVGLKMGKPTAIVRETQKKYGLGRQIEADLSLLKEYGVDGVVFLQPDFIDERVGNKVFEFMQEYCHSADSSLPLHQKIVTGTSDQPLFSTNVFAQTLQQGVKDIFLLEDLFTTGQSSIKIAQRVIDYCDSLGYEDTRVTVIGLVDREEGASENFSNAGISCKAVFTVTELTSTMLELGLMSDEQFDKINTYINERRQSLI